jgi:hypothetical protein
MMSSAADYDGGCGGFEERSREDGSAASMHEA